jgi:hypothetical protein
MEGEREGRGERQRESVFPFPGTLSPLPRSAHQPGALQVSQLKSFYRAQTPVLPSPLPRSLWVGLKMPTL